LRALYDQLKQTERRRSLYDVGPCAKDSRKDRAYDEAERGLDLLYLGGFGRSSDDIEQALNIARCGEELAARMLKKFPRRREH
jgi:hypothetical protein